MTPFKDDGQLRSLAEILDNKKHRRGHGNVENAFGILKENWRELLNKTSLDIAFVPDVVFACCILHNLTIHRRIVNTEEILLRLAIAVEHDLQLRHQGEWRLDGDEECNYNDNLRHGEIPGDE